MLPTHEKIMAEKSIYNSLAEWKKADRNGYSAAHRNGFIEKICETFEWEYIKYKSKPNGYWSDKENCKQEALKYNTKTEWMNKSKSSYVIASRNGWIEEFSTHMISLRPRISFEESKVESLKHNSKTEWLDKSPATVRWAKANGFYTEFTKHMDSIAKPKEYYTKEVIKEKIKKIITLKKFKDRYPVAYKVCEENNWLEELTSHMTKEKFVWSEEDIRKEAKKYPFKEK